MDKFAYGIEHHSDMIVQLVKSVNCKNYLELGIYDGSTLEKVSRVVPRVIGVDIKDLRINKNIGEFHQTSTQEFLNNFNEMVDVIFIDADHSFESVKLDLTRIEKNPQKSIKKYKSILIYSTTSPAGFL